MLHLFAFLFLLLHGGGGGIHAMDVMGGPPLADVMGGPPIHQIFDRAAVADGTGGGPFRDSIITGGVTV